MPNGIHYYRESIRLRGYDYAQAGAYYVTICTHERGHLFGEVVMNNAVDAAVRTTAIGDIAQRCWDAIPEHMPHVGVDAFMVMPNHIHGIVIIRERTVHHVVVGARHDAPLRKPPGIPRGALGQIVASYKSAVTRNAYHNGLTPHGVPVWQRNYYERIIRTPEEHQRIADYIADNPKNWMRDRFNGSGGG